LAGTRTRDKCLKRALLYQLSYQPITFKFKQLQIFRSGEDQHFHLALQPVPRRAFFVKRKEQPASELVAEQPIFPKVSENLSRLESSGGYYALLKRGGKQFRRSLKTKDRKFAERRPNDLRAKIGYLQISPEARLSFTQAAQLWLETNKHVLSSTVKRKKTTMRSGPCFGLTFKLARHDLSPPEQRRKPPRAPSPCRRNCASYWCVSSRRKCLSQVTGSCRLEAPANACRPPAKNGGSGNSPITASGIFCDHLY
jgi:hypothetical protein